MVECRSLYVKNILSDISFKVNKGEICVIIGKNGSGKTTLLRAISSNVAYSGDLIISGTPLKDMKLTERAKMIASMPQALPIAPISVKELVSFGRHPYTGMTGLLVKADKEIVETAITETDIYHITDRNLSIISGGELRKAYFAMMLAQRCPILLCDEPTANLDTKHQKQILELLKKQKSKGNTVLCVLHDINQAIAIADRILLIDGGRLAFDGTPEELSANKIPEKYFGLVLGNNYG